MSQGVGKAAPERSSNAMRYAIEHNHNHEHKIRVLAKEKELPIKVRL